MRISIIDSIRLGKLAGGKPTWLPGHKSVQASRSGFRAQGVLLPFAQVQVPELTRVRLAHFTRRLPARPRSRPGVLMRHFGRYRVLQPLGKGAMAAVFLARDPVLARLVAIKVLHPDLAFKKPLLDRFFKEAKIAARIQNPHIVEVFDFGQEGGSPYLVMEFIDGQPLQKVMDQMKGEPLDQVVAAALICQAAEGLKFAADAGVVHRDLKPDNLMLSAKGYLKVTDFGICHLADHTMTVTGQTLGSPRFMSPEQVKGLKPITVHSDLFSLGAVLYYCLSGQMPFTAQSLPGLYRQISEEEPPPLDSIQPGLDPFLVKLVETLLDKIPMRRGGGPGWLQYQLKRYLVQRKIVDPVSLIAQYVQEISSQGIQTTCNLDAATIRRHMGSFELEKTPETTLSRWKWIFAAIAIGWIFLTGTAFFVLWNRTPGTTLVNPLPQGKPRHVEPVKVSDIAPAHNRTLPSEKPRPKADVPGIAVPSPALKNEIPELAEAGEDSAAIQRPVYLTIYSSPPFADITLNGQSFGKTPIEGREMPSGRYRMVLTSKFAAPIDTVLTLSPGSQVHRFTLLSNPETRHEP